MRKTSKPKRMHKSARRKMPALKGSLAESKGPPVSPNRMSVKRATRMMQDPK